MSRTRPHRSHVLAALLAAAVLAIAPFRTDATADEPTPKDPPAISPTSEWYKDADCRLVFHAVLEGLYADGVPTDVVDLVIGKPATLAEPVKRCFVFRCDLCHAVYEAFAVYQRRPAFNGGGGVDTFGKVEIDASVKKALASDTPQSRVYAMGALVQPWIKRKLFALRMEDAEKRALMQRLMDLVQKGSQRFSEGRAKDPAYADWMFYGSCQACEAVKTVSEAMGTNK